MDDSVAHFLDKDLPLSTVMELPDTVTDFKTGFVDTHLRDQASRVNQLISGSETGSEMQSAGMGGTGEDCFVEMSTIMEGFRYLKNDNTLYPVLKSGQPC